MNDMPRGSGRVRTATLVGAALLIVGVVGGVWLFAVPRPPTLPSVADAPASTVDAGRLAWSTWGGDGRCLHVVDRDGEVTRRCEVDLDGDVVGWDDGEVVLESYARGEPGTIRVDPDTGATRTTSDGAATRSGQRDRAELETERIDGRLTVRVEGVTVWAVDAPAEYTVTWAQVDDTGDLVLLADRAGRLLLVPADGSATPRVWTTEVSSWQQVAWERAAS